jgi:hypothetical protein
MREIKEIIRKNPPPHLYFLSPRHVFYGESPCLTQFFYFLSLVLGIKLQSYLIFSSIYIGIPILFENAKKGSRKDAKAQRDDE